VCILYSKKQRLSTDNTGLKAVQTSKEVPGPKVQDHAIANT
jgi:hypothetical protein